MGTPTAVSLLLVSDDISYREAVADAVDHCPDITLTATVIPDETHPEHIAAPADCVLVDADTIGLSILDFRAALRLHHPTLPVFVATGSPAALPASLSTHAIVQKAAPSMLPVVARIVTTAPHRQTPASMSAEQQ